MPTKGGIKSKLRDAFLSLLQPESLSACWESSQLEVPAKEAAETQNHMSKTELPPVQVCNSVITKVLHNMMSRLTRQTNLGSELKFCPCSISVQLAQQN